MLNSQLAVIYKTPVGMFTTWKQASEACEGSGFNPCVCIKAALFDTSGRETMIVDLEGGFIDVEV